MRAPVKWDEQPLGDVPDCVLAYQNGVSISAVRQARMTRRIVITEGQRTLLRIPPDIELALMREFKGADLHVAVHLVLAAWMEARGG